MFFDGAIVAEGTPREFFSSGSFYTTSASRMARGLLPGAITPEDVIAACNKHGIAMAFTGIRLFHHYSMFGAKKDMSAVSDRGKITEKNC